MPSGVTDILEKMRANPTSDWTIADIEAVCRSLGIRCTAASGGGSHYKISHPSQRQILTVPSRRPIRPVYVRKFVRFVDAVGTGMRKRDYAVVIEPLPEEDGGGFLATVPDLPGCMSDGDTREEAARYVEDAIASWLDEAKALGREVPEPTALLRAG